MAVKWSIPYVLTHPVWNALPSCNAPAFAALSPRPALILISQHWNTWNSWHRSHISHLPSLGNPSHSAPDARGKRLAGCTSSPFAQRPLSLHRVHPPWAERERGERGEHSKWFRHLIASLSQNRGRRLALRRTKDPSNKIWCVARFGFGVPSAFFGTTLVSLASINQWSADSDLFEALRSILSAITMPQQNLECPTVEITCWKLPWAALYLSWWNKMR